MYTFWLDQNELYIVGKTPIILTVMLIALLICDKM